jgi:nucleotide-binding universal stress UspA family protein
MKTEILVYTAFTHTSRNALQYACELCSARNYAIVLIHNFDAPLNYSADALAFGSIEENIQNTEEKLAAEKEWAAVHYPRISIIHRLTYGTKENAIKDLMEEYNPEFLIVGAPESKGEFWGWNDSFVDILHLIPIPTLIIPKTVSYKAIINIGFACDYSSPLTPAQLKFIKNLVQDESMRLHIIHVNVPNKQNEAQRLLHRQQLEQELAAYDPVYVSIENSDVVATIINYVREHDIQLLLVIPRTHGLWYSIFNQRHTKRLTRINNLPIVTLKE